MLSKAIRIAAEAFEDKVDKGGQPYILHCLYVMNQMPEDDEELRCIAVMHDLVEDTSWTTGLLFYEGFSERVIRGVYTLTHESWETYDDYIKRISANKDAVKVKLADLRHNSDITRIKGLTKKDFDRMEKYHRAYTYLSRC
jgi:(p)ppGpp synthase/HD superfamily hydrolase